MAKTVYLDDFTDRSFFRGGSLAFGVFDGVHRGHRYLIDFAKADARHERATSTVLTFCIDPDELFGTPDFMKLMSNRERIRALGETGVDYVAVLPFDRSFASLPPNDFLNWTFGSCVPAHFHLGRGCRFGRRESGGIEELRAWGEPRGMDAEEHALLREDATPISSTRIRHLVADDDWQRALQLLGHDIPQRKRPCVV